MAIIKFIFTFLFFYMIFKLLRGAFFVRKVFKDQEKMFQGQKRKREASSKGDIIEAEFKVLDEEK